MLRRHWIGNLAVSQQVKTSTIVKVNIGTVEELQPVSVAKEMLPPEKTTMVELSKEYKDVFAWSYEDMKGLDPQFYQHHIHLNLTKCAFKVTSDTLLGHILSQEGIARDPGHRH